MTKRLKLFLAIILGSIAIACCAAGCSVGKPGREEVLSSYNGGQVTYYANGGCFNDNTAIVVRDIYFRNADVPFYDIGEEKDSIFITNSGYDFTGWYLPARHESGEHAGEIKYYVNDIDGRKVYVYPKLNSDGTPVTDRTEARPVFYSEGSDQEILEKYVRIEASSTPITQDYTVTAEDKLIVCATWKPALKFVFKLAVDEDGDYVYNNKTYHKGDTISTMAFGKSETKNPGQSTTVVFDNMTFVANYTEEGCINESGDYNRADYEGQAEIVVWSKFIQGKWTVIRNNPNDVKSMFTGLYKSANAYYLLNDVDCSTVTMGYTLGVKAKIEGNGHTLSNLKFNENSLSANFKTGFVFGDISATAQIKNLTLKDITINATGKGDMTFYAVCSSVAEGAVLENLTIDGITATVKLPGTVINVQNGDESNWIFGGKGTDAAFLAAYSGVNLTGTKTLTITK